VPARVRLLVCYEGTAYLGWQIQPQGPTVQAALEGAFLRMTGGHTRMVAAGRTDTGVHARGQVVCFRHDTRHDPRALQKGLNAHLPEDIAVLEAGMVPDDFDPRRQAVGKHYRYRIHNHPVRPVFERRWRWHLKKTLDDEAMNRAVAYLVGEHDFSAFRAADCEAASAVRRIDDARWVRHGPLLELDVFGAGFLKQMVRAIVGTCVEVGRGALAPGALQEILASGDRGRAGPTAPACGLVLERVYYREEEYHHAFAGV
jgi:tRNA pseudouridine38-40 synthase